MTNTRKPTQREMVALHALYHGLLKNGRVYGVNVKRQLEALADRGVIARTGADAYMIPYGSPGDDLIDPDFSISFNL